MTPLASYSPYLGHFGVRVTLRFHKDTRKGDLEIELLPLAVVGFW
jgi:hypothetical protein